MPAPPSLTHGPYAELQVTTNFCFLHSGSHPEELVMQAAELGHRAIAVTDRNTLAGVVRAHMAAKRAGIKLLVGARIDLMEGWSFLCFPQDKPAYSRLSQLITKGRRRAEKGDCTLYLSDLAEHAEGQIAIALPPDLPAPPPACQPHSATPDGPQGRSGDQSASETALAPGSPFHLGRGGVGWQDFEQFLEQIGGIFPDRAYLAAHMLYRGDDDRRLAHLMALAKGHGLPLVATNDVHYHAPERRVLQDIVTCIREHVTLEQAGFRLFRNAERHLKPAGEMARLFAACPEAIARTAEIADRLHFNLDALRYIYPADPLPEGATAQEELARLTWAGASGRYPGGIPESVRKTLAHELDLIGSLDYAPYFLTVYDIVRFARERDILCQGRGSAANSAVCYCLGITAVDPGQLDLLFERFISAERNEPPDIDVDFEHERREEVIQYVYEKYGRERAGIAATVICYRARSTIREVGKVLGLSMDTVDVLAKTVWGWSGDGLEDDHIRSIGLDPADENLRKAILLAKALIGFPRHLSQHVGGFVITEGPLTDLVPIENAAMEDRTVVEWDKDDLDALGILKIDVLALGMLTCIRKGFDLLATHYGKRYDLATIPAEDVATYDMICQADTVGVFQIESRAQMSMLPRLKPRDFYDLVIEVAIVRPGPIQGDMVHPYLRRRNGEEQVSFPSKELDDVLGKTLGVPLFQEQAMKIAIVAAGFTPSEADQLRRAMATFHKNGQIHGFREKMIGGMVARGYEAGFAERCFKQIEGFGDYGFPESHAASFALLVYVSAWMKCHYPEVFACALLNSQPMGFYASAQIVRDARDHGVEVLPVDVNYSEWDNKLEPGADGRFAIRLGFRQIKGLREAHMQVLVARRGNGYADPWLLWRRTGLPARVLERLARADAYGSMAGESGPLGRRDALWAVKRFRDAPLPLFDASGEDEQANDPEVTLPEMTLGEQVIDDYASLRLSLKAHPMELLRPEMDARGTAPNEDLLSASNGDRIEVAGIVLVRQRPGTAKGVIFMTLEDETGISNIVVWRNMLERYRPIVMGARLVAIRGEVQREQAVIHVVAQEIIDLSHLLDGLGHIDPFAIEVARADEIRRNSRDSHMVSGHVTPRDPRRDRLADPLNGPIGNAMFPSRDFH